MKKVLVLFTMVACLAFGQTSAKQRMVVVISLDGFPAYALDDPKLPIPTLRKLIRNGVTARMGTVNPTVTWPNHTAIISGVRSDEHGLLANGTIQKIGNGPAVKVEPMLEKDKMVHVPTVYDAAFEAGLTTAQVDWVAIEKAKTITWPFAEWATPAGAVEQEMIRKGAISAADLENFTKSNILFRDQTWTTAGVHLIREHKPNLLLFHLLTLDSTHHSYGPGTLAATDAIAFLDSCVARLVDAVHAAGMDQNTTFIVVSDHGFKKYTKLVKPAVALEAAGLSKSVFILAEGGTAYVYFDRSQTAELTPKITAALQGAEGIDKILGPADFPAMHLPSADKDPQMYQLLLTAKDGYAFNGATGGPVTAAVPQQAGSHGYPASDPDMDAIFIASGYGVKAGGKLDKIQNVDVASTLAELLGVKLPGARGKAIPLR